ncbi:MAG TPA: M20 family metallopeptidase [Acidimicrobiales bacterium]|nr:M20 family metallopeptidase [Acidimicrobiales bacterium]
MVISRAPLTALLASARELESDLIALRRRLHQVPELGLHLPRTKEIVMEALVGLPVEISQHTDTSGVVATLRGEAGGGHDTVVLLRGDMDALPLIEQTGLPYAVDEPRMHACGHDLHTSMLLGAARILSQWRDSLPGSVVFMFQPGEEGFDGARHMIDAGVLGAAGRMADAAYALHVNPAVLTFGTVATRGGTLLSAVGTMTVRVIGKGGHGSRPHRAKDPVPVLAEIVLALQAMVTRQFDAFDPVVLTVGVLRAGTKFNIIPDEAYLEGTVRTFSAEQAKEVEVRATRLCTGIAASHGLQAEMEFHHLYPTTNNSPTEAARMMRVAAELFGEDSVHEYANPQPGSEDFSRVLNEVPGAMAFLGACPIDGDPTIAAYNHSAHAVYDDSVVSRGAALLAGTAWDRMTETALHTAERASN